jgi:hypothetical protein
MKRSHLTALGAALALGAAATVAACGGDDSSTNPGNDAGMDATRDTGMPGADASDGSMQNPDTGTHDSGKDTGTTGDAGSDTGTTGDASDGGGNTDSGGDSGGDSGSDAGDGGITLTIKNVLSWCSIAINGSDAGSSNAIITATVPAGVNTLVATAEPGFIIGGADMWFGIDQNDGGAAPGVDSDAGGVTTSTATVTITGDHCVQVCCPFPAGNGCPTSNTMCP